jgi:hypothetical protein
MLKKEVAKTKGASALIAQAGSLDKELQFSK